MNQPSVSLVDEPAKPAARFGISPEKLLQSVVDVICAIDAEGVFRYVSAASQQLLGYTPSEMTGASFQRFIFPADIDKTVKIFAERTHDCKSSSFENRYYHKNGSLVPLIWSGRWDEYDQLLYCVARDGSKKRELENRLIKAQQMARVADFEYDIQNKRYSHVSETLYDIFGLDRAVYPEFTSELFWLHVHPDDAERVRNNIQQPEQFYDPELEYRIIRTDGKIVYISRTREVIRDAAGKPVKAIGTVQDITERKMGELAMQQSEDRFRHLVHNGNDMVGIIDEHGTYSFVGANVVEHLGYQPDELVGKNAFQFIHPDDLEWLSALLVQMKDLTNITTKPFRFIDKKGEWRWVETTVSNHLDNPSISGLIVNSRDITKKKMHDDEMKASEQRFKALVQNGSDLIVVLDEKACFTYVSDNVTSIMGYTPEEVLHKSAFDFIHEEDAGEVASEFFNVLHDAESAIGVQHRFRHKNGGWVWLESKGSNHQENQRIKGILVNSRNINDRVLLQKQLDQALINQQREITAAIIKTQECERSQIGLELHDHVNQVLTTVKLYNEMYLTGYVQDKELLVKSTGYVQECINEIRSISKRLSAPTLGNISVCDSLKELVDSVNLTRRLFIHYVHSFPNCGSISNDLHLAIYRIVQEGINNIIKFSQATEAWVEIALEGETLCLKISDNGIGLHHVYSQAGTGIAHMRTRAESHNARFEISSMPGKGSHIHIYFQV